MRPDSALTSVNGYARHRGVSSPTVRNAIKRGRLKRCLARDSKGVIKIADLALADREWGASADHSTTPPAILEQLENASPAVPPPPAARPTPPPSRVSASGGGGSEDDDDLEPPDLDTGEEMTLSRASAIEKQWRAKLVRLEYRKKAGELVEAAEVAARLTDTFTICRNKLLGLPTRARQRIPGLTTADVLILDGLVREALEELSNPNG